MAAFRIADVCIRDFHEFVLYELATPDVYPIHPEKHGPKPYPEDVAQPPRYYVSWNESRGSSLDGVPSLTLWCLRTNRRVTVGEPEGWESWWDREEDCIEPADVIRHVVDILYRDVVQGTDTHVERLLTPTLCKRAVDLATMFDSTVAEPSYSQSSRASSRSRSGSFHLEDDTTTTTTTNDTPPLYSNMTNLSLFDESPIWMGVLNADRENTVGGAARGRKRVRFKPSSEWERRSASADR